MSVNKVNLAINFEVKIFHWWPLDWTVYLSNFHLQKDLKDQSPRILISILFSMTHCAKRYKNSVDKKSEHFFEKCSNIKELTIHKINEKRKYKVLPSRFKSQSWIFHHFLIHKHTNFFPNDFSNFLCFAYFIRKWWYWMMIWKNLLA